MGQETGKGHGAAGRKSLAPSEQRISRIGALNEINDRFGVGDSVRQLRDMMGRVTEKEITPDTVNAACNCVQNINSTIKTAIMAASFMSSAKE